MMMIFDIGLNDNGRHWIQKPFSIKHVF
jgi:hypothetical protein